MAQGTVVQSGEARIMNFDPQRCFISFYVADLLKNVKMLTVQIQFIINTLIWHIFQKIACLFHQGISYRDVCILKWMIFR